MQNSGKLFFAFLTLFTLLSACKNEPNEANSKVTPEPKKSFEDKLLNDSMRDCRAYFSEAKKMDSTLLVTMEMDYTLALRAIRSFADYAFYCENDSLSPAYLLKAGQVAISINNGEQAKLVLDRCINNYPKFKNRPAAMFLLAQAYDETHLLNNEEEAGILYNKIIEEYPKSEWANNAKAAIKLLGKTDEQILREFKQKAK